MKRPTTLTEIMQYTMRGARIEPVKRVKDIDHVPRGRRNEPVQPRYIWHTYPIIGGITGARLMAENVERHNALFRRLAGRE